MREGMEARSSAVIERRRNCRRMSRTGEGWNTRWRNRKVEPTRPFLLLVDIHFFDMRA